MFPLGQRVYKRNRKILLGYWHKPFKEIAAYPATLNLSHNNSWGFPFNSYCYLIEPSILLPRSRTGFFNNTPDSQFIRNSVEIILVLNYSSAIINLDTLPDFDEA